MIVVEMLKSKFFKPLDYARNIGVKFGENCEFYSGVEWGSEPYLIEIGSNVRIASGCKFITHDGGMWVLRNLKKLEDADAFGRIIIGNNVHIGMNVIIMPGVQIGDNCIVACGAVVTKNIESNTIVGGVPAKFIENIDDYYEKHKYTCDYTKHMSYKEKKEYLIKKYDIK